MEEVETLVRDNFKPVHVGGHSPQKASLSPMRDISPEQALSHTLRHDPTFVRRLKKENYGKWYLKPAAFENKVTQLNLELESANSL